MNFLILKEKEKAKNIKDFASVLQETANGYSHRKPSESLKYKIGERRNLNEADTKKLKKEYSSKSIYTISYYAPKVLKALENLRVADVATIASELNVHRDNISSILSAIRKLGMVEVVEGKTREEFIMKNF